jgi:hypothetical protein
VTMSLARHLREDCFTGLSGEELEYINLKSKPVEEDGALVFTILPRIERYDYDKSIDRYALLIKFLKAA